MSHSITDIIIAFTAAGDSPEAEVQAAAQSPQKRSSPAKPTIQLDPDTPLQQPQQPHQDHHDELMLEQQQQHEQQQRQQQQWEQQHQAVPKQQLQPWWEHPLAQSHLSVYVYWDLDNLKPVHWDQVAALVE